MTKQEQKQITELAKEVAKLQESVERIEDIINAMSVFAQFLKWFAVTVAGLVAIWRYITVGK